MSFALVIAAFVLSGLALLRLLRLATGHRATDLALAWLAGSGAFALAAPLVRFGLGIPLSRATALALVLLAPAAWMVRRLRRALPPGADGAGGPARRDGGPASERAAAAGVEARQREVRIPGVGAGEGADAQTEAGPRRGGDGGGRATPARSLRPGWLPGAAWLFAPMAAYVTIVMVAILLHGANTPTHTDDGVRVRAFAPMLAFDDGWEPAARAVLVVAGALPTFAPALGWTATGTVDHFHVNYFVLAELAALLVLVVAVCTSRGEPERGWASAFAILSIPLFVYHCTSTYSDAVLAMRVAGGVLFAMEYSRTRAAGDAARALLLLALAALVKREGELVAAAPAAVLVAQLAWERSRGGALPWRAIAAGAVPLALGALGRISAVGVADAFPMLAVVARQSAEAVATAPGRGAGATADAAAFFLEHALFRSGNAGMIYWVLAAAILVRAPALLGTGAAPGRAAGRSTLLWPLAAVVALLGEVTVSSIWLVPEYTLDQSTVHRALMVASVPAALWIAAALTEAVREEVAADAPAAAAGGRPGAKATPPPRRRRRRASRP